MVIWLLIQGPMTEARIISQLGPEVAADAKCGEADDERRAPDR